MGFWAYTARQAAQTWRDLYEFGKEHVRAALLAFVISVPSIPLATRMGSTMSQQWVSVVAQSFIGPSLLLVLALLFFWVRAPSRLAATRHASEPPKTFVAFMATLLIALVILSAGGLWFVERAALKTSGSALAASERSRLALAKDLRVAKANSAALAVAIDGVGGYKEQLAGLRSAGPQPMLPPREPAPPTPRVADRSLFREPLLRFYSEGVEIKQRAQVFTDADALKRNNKDMYAWFDRTAKWVCENMGSGAMGKLRDVNAAQPGMTAVTPEGRKAARIMSDLLANLSELAGRDTWDPVGKSHGLSAGECAREIGTPADGPA